MVVITVTDCPPKLRGDLTKWMLEIDTGVYVGHFSARVREELWKRVCQNIQSGRASMIFNTSGEQHFGFCVHNSRWIPEDYDGITLIKHLYKEKTDNEKEGEEEKTVWRSNASIQQLIRDRQKYGVQNRNKATDSFVIIDLETTGLDEREDKIIEVGLLQVEKGEVVKEYSSLVKTDHPVPDKIVALTGITSELLEREGKSIKSVISEVIAYIGTRPVVCHNPGFDLSFLCVACQKYEVPMPSIKAIDTCSMARRKIKAARSYRLRSLAEQLEISFEEKHRALDDCYITLELYNKLNEID